MLPNDITIGIELTDYGKKDNITFSNKNISKISDEYNYRHQQVRNMLRRMEEPESNDDPIYKLWIKTRQWSLTEFKRIYNWLDVRFDHDFFESEVGEESRQLVIKAYEDGILTKSDGAIIADLKKEKLNVCVLLKSNGAGLYATKDLALATRKFNEFEIDKSIYVVDAAQTLHFQQVFAILDKLGYQRQAKKCIHLPYGLVVLPHGKMSSRANTVIVFNDLVKLLEQQISQDYLDKYKGIWTDDEIKHALRVISIAVIKYGMLNHDTAKNIIFKLKDWSAKSGDTGPYMLYQYARCQSILNDYKNDTSLPLYNYNTLTRVEQNILAQLSKFWNVVEDIAKKNNPSTLCNYLYSLAKSLSSWYELPTSRINKLEDQVRKATLLRLIKATSLVIKQGMKLLGIPVLNKM